jgi:hypothetical protein
MSSFNLQKWSLDVATDHGDVLCAELISYGLAGFGRTILTADAWTADGREVHDSLATELPIFGPAGRVGVRGFSLGPDRDGFRLALDLPRIGLDLLCASGGEWRPNGSGVLLTKGTRVFRWVVPQFRASVSGSLAFGSEKFDVRGEGCLEIVSSDLPPWRLRFAKILRGTAYFPSTTLLFLELRTGEGAVSQNILVKRDLEPEHRTEAVRFPPRCGAGREPPRLRWIDDYQFQLDDRGHPGQTVLRHPAFTLCLTEKRALESGTGPLPREVRPAFLWKLLDRLYGRPESRKVLAEAHLSMGGREELGLAFHERVVRRRGLKA